MSLIRRLLTPDRPPSVPAGIRVYAIGDIHGRADLLTAMMTMIRTDIQTRRVRRPLIVFLGDYIDRGPQSAEVIDQLTAIAQSDALESRFLMGNHEEVLLRILKGDGALLHDWLRFGGRECLASYGLDGDALAKLGAMEMAARMKDAIPRRHRQFLGELIDTVRVGDYLFVHAGLRPNLALEAQSQQDLRWIRSPFLEDETADHGYMVVHGHSMRPEVDRRANRIGIDTGAYQSGRLTALVLDGATQTFLQTEP